METTGSNGGATNPARGSLKAWLAIGCSTLAAFMAMMDVSIVNSSLPTIQGEIGATASEGTWIGTAYLISEVIVTPLTDWFCRMFGMRRFLLIAVSMFTAFSMLCGISSNLEMMIIGRIGQGLAGGAMIPLGITMIATLLPPREQAKGIAVFASAILCGPILGPLVGGWITENWSWHYAFFINLPICLGVIVLLLFSLPGRRADWNELRTADWMGIAGMAIGLGSLMTLIEEGHRELWFDSMLIRVLAASSALGFLMVGWGQLHATRPVIRLSILRNRPYAAAVMLIMVVGALIFGSSFVIPQFLAAVAGYNAYQAGSIALLSGMTAALLMPAAPTLIRLIDVRIVLCFGCTLIGISSYLTTGLTPGSAGSDFALAQLIFGAGFAIVTFTLQQASVMAVAEADVGEASALFVAARNVGGAIGLAAIASFQDGRIESHRWTMYSAISANDPAVQQWFATVSAAFGGGQDGMDSAHRVLDHDVMMNALAMAYNDVFLMLTLAIIISMPLIALLKPLKGPPMAAGH